MITNTDEMPSPETANHAARLIGRRPPKSRDGWEIEAVRFGFPSGILHEYTSKRLALEIIQVLAEDKPENFAPIAWFETFDIDPECLRSAAKSGRLPVMRVGRQNRYHWVQARRIFPDKLTENYKPMADAEPADPAPAPTDERLKAVRRESIRPKSA